MRTPLLLVAFVASTAFVAGQTSMVGGWISYPHDGYTLRCTPSDTAREWEYAALIANEIRVTGEFFHAPYIRPFDVFVHPDRRSLDSTWRVDWKMPGFTSECWMVASGVANKLDVLSPATWDTASCEHSYSNKLETQQLITHELVHVYHGQHNPSPDFSDVTGLDWFVEGLATYVSGQCDSTRLAQVRNALEGKDVPQTLEKFWTGKWKYGLSGSVVMYLDHRYGRETLINLLRFTTLNDLLASLHISQAELLKGWRTFVVNDRP